jgi:flagellar biosynthesis GTPase FlhF
MVELTDLDGVASGRAENLQEAGYESVEDVAAADAEVMGEVVNYLPQDTALSLIVQAQDMIEEAEEDDASEESALDGDGSITEEISEAADETSEAIEEEGEALSPDEALEELDEELDEELKEEVESAAESVDEESFEEELDELEEAVAETSDESPSSDEPEPASSEEPEPELSGEIVFELTLETPMQYDTLYDCVMDQRATLIRTNRDGVDAFSEVLDIVRQASYGETVELSMDEGTLNDFHNAVRKKGVEYKGDNLIEHMDAINKVLNQVNTAREENLF